jgi:hypothetical protein
MSSSEAVSTISNKSAVGNHDNKQASKHGGSMVVNATSTMELKFEQRIERAIKHEIKDRKRGRISARN